MRYDNIEPGIFLSRPNRFVAKVALGGQVADCHVKNTGRCRELLIPGARVWCQRCSSPGRKTVLDLITVEKGGRLINLDSQAPNRVAMEWLQAGGLGQLEGLQAEKRYGDSRFDLAFSQGGRACFLEVKGVTLEEQGVCSFPDAPTQRGSKHLRGLMEALQAGYGAYVLFVIQMAGAKCLRPHDETDPVFGRTLREAAAMGVSLLAMECQVTPDSMTITTPVPITL